MHVRFGLDTKTPLCCGEENIMFWLKMLVFVATIAAGDVQTSCETCQFFYRHKHGWIFFRDLVKYTSFFVCLFSIITAGDVPTSCQNHPVVGNCLHPAVSRLQKLKLQTRSLILTFLLIQTNVNISAAICQRFILATAAIVLLMMIYPDLKNVFWSVPAFEYRSI